jgi:hypothetical protein
MVVTTSDSDHPDGFTVGNNVFRRMGGPIAYIFDSLDGVIVHLNRSRPHNQSQNIGDIEIVEQAAGSVAVTFVSSLNLSEASWIEGLAEVFAAAFPGHRTQRLPFQGL